MLPILINKYRAKPFVRNRHDREITQTTESDYSHTYRQATTPKQNRYKMKEEM